LLEAHAAKPDAAVIGGAVLYLRRRARAIESEAQAQRIATPSRLVSRSSSSQ
jgi:hypothetical protein